MSKTVMPEVFVLDTRSALRQEVEVRLALEFPVDSDVAKRLMESHWRIGGPCQGEMIRIPDGELAGDYTVASTIYTHHQDGAVFEVNLKMSWSKP